MKEHYPFRSCADAPLRASTGPAARLRQCVGFTLTEVVLAVGVLSLAILALVGLFGPTMSAVKEVVDRSGAMAVSDQLNAELLSDKIYFTLGIEDNADPFKEFRGKMIKREEDEDTGESNVNSFPAATPGVGGVLYAWKQFDPNRNQVSHVDLKLSALPPSNADLKDLDGSVYLIFMERGLQFIKPKDGGSYDFEGADVDDYAYFPMQVSIYEAPMNLIVASNGSSLSEGDVLKPTINNLRGKPLFQYSTAKLR